VRTVPTRKADIFLCRAFLGMKVLGWKSLNDTPNSSQTNGVSRPISSLLRKIRECLQILDTSARSFDGNGAKQVEESSTSSGSTSSATPAASAPPKRGPGRPRKHPLPPDAVAANDAPLPPSEAPPKKKRGRPRKKTDTTQPQPPSEIPPKKKRGRPRKNAETTQSQPLFENEALPSVIIPRKESVAVNAHIVGAPLEKVLDDSLEAPLADGIKHGASVEEISDDGDTNPSSTASKPEVADVAIFLQNLNDLEDVFEKQLKEKTRERDRKQSELLKIQQEISVLDQDIVQLKEKKKVEVDDHMKKITGAGFYRKKA